MAIIQDPTKRTPVKRLDEIAEEERHLWRPMSGREKYNLTHQVIEELAGEHFKNPDIPREQKRRLKRTLEAQITAKLNIEKPHVPTTEPLLPDPPKAPNVVALRQVVEVLAETTRQDAGGLPMGQAQSPMAPDPHASEETDVTYAPV